jgi:hypothetical protein
VGRRALIGGTLDVRRAEQAEDVLGQIGRVKLKERLRGS